MRISFAVILLLLGVLFVLPASAEETQPPAAITEKMAFKFGRGVTNIVTSVAEIPKQTVLTVRNHGGVGYVIGPIAGIGMTLYRGFIGAVEMVFCVVPQPGYYDPMMDPEFVWHGWEDKRAETQSAKAD